jgi:primosomal protein N'
MPLVGARVAVPFGPKLVTAVVSDLAPPPAPEGVKERDLVAVLDEEPFLTAGLVAVLLRASRYYFAPPGELLRAAVPARLLTGAEAVYGPPTRRGRPENERETSDSSSSGPLNLSELAKDSAPGSLASQGPRGDGGAHSRQSARSSRATGADLPPVGFRCGAAAGSKQKALFAHLVALERSAGMAELKGEGFTPGLAAALVKAGAASFGVEERRADLSRHVGAARPNERFRFTEAQGAAIDGVSVALSEGVEAS